MNNLNWKRFLKVSFGFGPKVGPKPRSLSSPQPAQSAAAARACGRWQVGPTCQGRRQPPAAAAKPSPSRRLPSPIPPQSDPFFSGFLRGFDPLVLLYLSPQESEQMVEYFIRIELVFEFISKTEFLFSRSDSSRLESDLFNPRL